MSDETLDKPRDNNAYVEAIADRVARLDPHAEKGNKRATWKHYMGYAVLAIAKEIGKKEIQKAVFGDAGKPSKAFANMWSLAKKASPHLSTRNSWSAVPDMAVDDAVDFVVLAIDEHMSELNVDTKNSYEKVCGGRTLSSETGAETPDDRDAERIIRKLERVTSDLYLVAGSVIERIGTPQLLELQAKIADLIAGREDKPVPIDESSSSAAMSFANRDRVADVNVAPEFSYELEL
jgi:hypothetical protein